MLIVRVCAEFCSPILLWQAIVDWGAGDFSLAGLGGHSIDGTGIVLAGG